MKMDSKTKAASNPARLKTNNSKHTGSDTGKKPDRSVTRTKRAKGQLPGIKPGESIGSRQRLLATYEHAPIGIIENSLEGNYVNCNEEFCRITGYEKEELLTLTIKDLTYEEDYIFDIKLHQRLVAGEIPFYKLEKRYVRKDGQLIWAEVSRSLMRDADGKPLYTIGAVLDVSERRQAELEIRNLSRIPTENPNPVMRLTPDGNVLYANPASAALLKFWKQQLHQTIPDELKKHVAEVFASGLKNVIEIEHHGKSFSCTLAPIREAGYVNFYGNDISERKQAEEALRRNEKMFSTLVDAAPFGVYFIDSEFRMRAINKGSESVFSGIHPLIGRDFAEILRSIWQEPFATEAIERFYHTLRTGESFISPPVIEQRANIEEIQSYDWQIHRITLSDGTFGVVCYFYDLSEQKRMEAAVRISEERYRNLFDLVPVAVYSCDADGLIQEFNHRAVDLWGREPRKNDPDEKYCGSFKIYDPDGRFMPHAACPMARILRGETLEPHELEILVERADGVRRSVIAHPLPLKNERGEIIGAINCLYDITDRKQAEEKIIFQASLLGAVGSAVIATDLNGIVMFWNPAAEKMYGWSSSEALGKNVMEVAPAPQSQEQAGEIMKQLANGKSWSGDFLVQRRDGSTFPAFVSDSPILDSNGRLAGIIGVSSDITELKQAEEALQQLNLQLESRVQSRTEKLNNAIEALREEISERRQAEELLRRWAHIFEHADWGIATIRQDTFTMVNPTYAKMHGYTAEELVGRSIFDVFDPESHADLREQIRIAYKNGHHIYESKHIRRDGSIFPVLVDTTVVRDEAGDVLYRAVNVQDITERKRVEQELRESREHLQILSRRLVEVQEEERRAIARELHDRVGQTLAALNINLMIMNGQIREDSKQLIGSRMTDTMRLVAEAIALVRNVMTDLRPAVLDDYGLEAALQSYIDEYKSRYDIKVVLVPPDQPIPRLGPSLEMTLLRIAQEALFNIARHAQADSVNVSLRLQDNAVHLMVQDNGVGIHSWPDANRPGSHGLTIMRERADAFGGSLNVGSVPGVGTKVEASIPLQNGNQNKVQEEK